MEAPNAEVSDRSSDFDESPWLTTRVRIMQKIITQTPSASHEASQSGWHSCVAYLLGFVQACVAGSMVV